MTVNQLLTAIANAKLSQSTNPDWLHLFIGYALVISLRFLGLSLPLCVLANEVWALVVEYWFDRVYEKQLNADNARNVLFYSVGAALAVIIIVLHGGL